MAHIKILLALITIWMMFDATLSCWPPAPEPSRPQAPSADLEGRKQGEYDASFLNNILQ